MDLYKFCIKKITRNPAMAYNLDAHGNPYAEL